MQPANDKHRIGSMIAVLILVFMAAENNRPVFSKQLLAGLIKLIFVIFLNFTQSYAFRHKIVAELVL